MVGSERKGPGEPGMATPDALDDQFVYIGDDVPLVLHLTEGFVHLLGPDKNRLGEPLVLQQSPAVLR